MALLQISFYGPFVYDFSYPENGVVQIFAPKCAGHQAGIFSAKTEHPLRGRPQYGNQLIYSLAGSVFDPYDYEPPELCGCRELILNIPPTNPPQDYKAASFCLEVPMPAYVYPLNPSPDLEVVTTGTPCGKLRRYATGLRFYYEAKLSQIITLSICGNVIWESDFDEVCDSGVSNSDVIVRYANTAPEDPDHGDAAECFSRIAGLCGQSDWWLSYEDPQNPGVPSGFVRNGSDCGAPIMTVGADTS